MSFDSEFDYTNAKNYLNGRISMIDNEISNHQDELNNLANISGHSSLVISRQNDLNHTTIEEKNIIMPNHPFFF